MHWMDYRDRMGCMGWIIGTGLEWMQGMAGCKGWHVLRMVDTTVTGQKCPGFCDFAATMPTPQLYKNMNNSTNSSPIKLRIEM